MAGRPRRPLPRGIGELPDDAVAYLSERDGEPMTADAVRMLRNLRGIPPASEPHRSRWFSRRGIEPSEWDGPLDSE